MPRTSNFLPEQGRTAETLGFLSKNYFQQMNFRYAIPMNRKSDKIKGTR